MNITGQKALENIVENHFYVDTLTVGDEQNIDLDGLFERLDKHITDITFMHLDILVAGGVSEGGTTLTLETNIINLPLRYTNQLKKLVWPEKTDNDVNLYMIIENEFVSQSHLVIALASSVAAYLDYSDSVKYKISQWFTNELSVIQEHQSGQKNDEK